jgi:hypothetical protein
MLTSWVRTVVPAAWATVISLAVAHGLLDTGTAAAAGGVANTVIVPFVLAVLYAALRWLETQPWMPRWAVLLLLGSATPPTYTPATPPPPQT